MSYTVAFFRQAKQSGTKISMLTAYDYSMAKLMDEAGIHGVLIGDSVGMVSLGYKTTLPVTMEEIIHHTKAVSRACGKALVVADMPFMSYQASTYDAVTNAGRLVKEGGAQAVKLEGGLEIAAQIQAIVAASIPVMGHIGLTPQSVNVFGGFKVQGKDEETARQLVRSARAVEQAGAFAVVLEAIPAKLAELVTQSVSIPTIGIGAGKACDGQILVYQDMLGLFSDFTPKFVKQYANLGPQVREAFASYIKEVQNGSFPSAEHTFSMDDSVLEKLY